MALDTLAPESLAGSIPLAQSDRIPQDANFIYAQGFWLVHADLLPQACGVVAQFGIDPQGGFQDATRPAKEVVTLAFDSGSRLEDLYRWELMIATRGEGRTLSQLHAYRFGAAAVQRTYDVQGKAGPDKPVDAGELSGLVEAVIGEDFVQERIAQLREQRAQIQVELERFSVTGLKTLGSEKYERELQTRKRNLAKSGFGLWAMQQL